MVVGSELKGNSSQSSPLLTAAGLLNPPRKFCLLDLDREATIWLGSKLLAAEKEDWR